MDATDRDVRTDMGAMLEAAGIRVTNEGKARARAKLAAADAEWTPERWDALRKQLGMPPKAAA